MNIYSCSGDGNYMHIYGDVDFDDGELGFPFSSDRWDRAVSERPIHSEISEFFSFRSELPTDRRIKPRFSDCMMIFSSVNPAYWCTSFNNLVSEKAKSVLESVTQNEIAFLPIALTGAPTQYFAMWVRRILDAVDRENSDLKPDHFNEPGRYRLGANCQYRHVDARFAFRIPAWRYDENADLVTEQFVECIKDAGLSGFNFRLSGPSEMGVVR